MKTIKLQLTGKVAMVDDEDFERLSKFKWWLAYTGNITRKFSKNNRTKHISLASEVMNKPGVMHDHIDRDPFNNQKSNLRQCNYSQNAGNQKINKAGRTSKYRGVFLNRRDGTWRAVIRRNGKIKCIGTFKSEELAAKHYDVYALEFFKEFACLNFPKSI